MKVAAIPVALAMAGTSLAQNSTLTTGTTANPGTTVVSALTTVCGTATVLTQNGNYYTCTEAMTLTITDCPCTMTHPSYFANISTPTASPNSISISTIIVPAFCPTTTTTSSLPTLAQNADYTPTCQAPAGGGGSGSGGENYGSPLSTSWQGYAAGTAVRPSASQYAYTSAGTRSAAAGSAGAAMLFFFPLAAVFVVAAVRLPDM